MSMGYALAVILMMPAQQSPATAPPAAPVESARAMLALELAQLLNSRELTEIQTRKLLSETMPRALTSDPDVAELERDYPGILAAMVEAMGPILAEVGIGTLPQLWARLAPIYSDRLTEQELREVIAFYRSPTGAKVLRHMAEKVDFGEALATMIRGGGEDITAETLRNATSPALTGLREGLTPVDWQEVERFARSSSGIKFALTEGETNAATAAWSNEPTPEADARAEAAMIAVIEKFTGRKIEP